jgi:hypothetical protein
MTDNADNLPDPEDPADDSTDDPGIGEPETPIADPILSSTPRGESTSSTEENRLDLSSDYDPEPYQLQRGDSETTSTEPSAGWQQIHKVDTSRSELAAKSPRKKKRKTKHTTVLIGCNVILFLASICVMVLEITASRLIAKHVGSSVYTWTSVIGVVLAGITVGNFLGGWLADRFKPEKLISRLFILASVSCFSVLWLDQLIGTSERPEGIDWPTWVFLTVAQMFFLPAMALGTISPVVASVALSHSKRTGITVGNVYAWGAMGSIVGTFLTGFYLIDVFGTRAIIGGTAGALALLAAITASGQLALRMAIMFGWLQFLTAATLAASMTAEVVGELGDQLGDLLIDRDPTLVQVESWYLGETPALEESIRAEFAKKCSARELKGLSEADYEKLEQWTKYGRRDRLVTAEKALEILFSELHKANEKQQRWREHAELLGENLHELGLLLFLRNDALGEYHDESNYSYINVSNEVDEVTGDLVKQLRLDKLAHSYVNLTEPTKLYYEYESIYAELTNRVSSSWQSEATVSVPAFRGLNDIVANLPKWSSYDAESDILTITGVLNPARRGELLKASKHGAYWLALDELAKATQDTYWGGFSSISLKSLPVGADISNLLKEKMSFDSNLGVLNAFKELTNADVERLAAIGEAHASVGWRTAVSRLFNESRTVRTFFIGGGGFVFPRWIEHHFPHQSRIDVAELDPAVKLAVQQAMGLPDDGLTQINTLIGDARNIVDDLLLANKRRPKGQAAIEYDFIFGDAFNDLSVPWHLTTREFNQKVKLLLDEKHGVYLINIIDIWPRSEFPKVEATDGDEDLAAEGLTEVDGFYQIVAYEGETPDDWKVEYDVLELWQPLRDPTLSGAESLARDDGKFRFGFRGLMTNRIRKRLMNMRPNDADYVAAVDSMFRDSQATDAPGRFLSSCVNTLIQDFPNVYVFSTQHGPPENVRDTFVIAASLAPLDFSRIETTGSHWDTPPFAVYEKSGERIHKTGQMDALLDTAQGLVLTDDFAPIDRLLRPVFVDQE